MIEAKEHLYFSGRTKSDSLAQIAVIEDDGAKVLLIVKDY